MYSSFLFISVFFSFFFLFQFLDRPSQKRVIFTKKWLLTNIFTSSRSFFCCCLDYSRTNGQIFIKKFVGRTWPKEEIITFWERSGSYFKFKKIMNFQFST